MQLCGFELARGEKKEVSLPIAGVGNVRATLICGAQPGKTLVVTAGVHGCEYNGIEALRGLCATLNPAALRGQVILVPLMNPSGFYHGAKQVVPEDGINLNRAFPGAADGTHAARIAAAVEALLYPHADLLVDLHGGDVNEMAMAFAYFPVGASTAVRDASRAAAQALSLPYRVTSTAKNGLYSWAAQRGVPALLLERGGLGRWSEAEVHAYQQNVYELLNHLGILPQDFPQSNQREITRAAYIEAAADGFWYPAVDAGQEFSAGDLLGTLRSDLGDAIQTVYAEFDGVVLYYTLSLGVKTDDPLIAYGAR